MTSATYSQKKMKGSRSSESTGSANPVGKEKLDRLGIEPRTPTKANGRSTTELPALQVCRWSVEPQIPTKLSSLLLNLSLKAWKQKGSTRKQALTGAEASECQQKAMARAQDSA